MNNQYRICTRCIMDTSDPEITFDEQGVCSHCHQYDVYLPKRVIPVDERPEYLRIILDKIKKDGKNKEYDCIIGVSGGVDSTYVAYWAKNNGLRPLAIHFDNGWNSELAVSNIEKTLDTLNIDLYTYVIDWEIFRDLQLSFLKASTPDGEIPTDHAINALLFKEANKRNIKYILSGMNYATESSVVKSWAYGHSDWKYIKSVHKIFRTKPLRKYPYYTFFSLFWWTFIRKIKSVAILNYIDYNKEEAMGVLENKLGWKYYGGKHYESVYTRFYQGYILPEKFNIDKRRIHLSDLIKSGQITRDQALIEMEKPVYDKNLLIQDMEFVKKKLGLNDKGFDSIMKAPIKSFRDYPNNEKWVSKLKEFVHFLRGKNLYSK